MDTYSIQAVSLRTGLSPYVLRAWEQRYGAVRPERTATGRRRYTQDQVKRLDMLAQARASGHSIGSIASLPLEDLSILVGKPTTLASPAIADALEALPSLEPASLDSMFESALRAYGRLEFIDEFMFPFIKDIKKAIENGTLRSAHLSFAQTRLREVLSLVNAAIPIRPDAPRLLLSSASGLEHEPGLLGSAMFAASAGWCPIRFNPGTPVEELAYVAEVKHIRAIVYSIISSSQSAGSIAEAVLLRRLAPPDAVVMFGGRLDSNTSDILIDAGLERIQDMHALRNRLCTLLQADNPMV